MKGLKRLFFEDPLFVVLEVVLLYLFLRALVFHWQRPALTGMEVLQRISEWWWGWPP
jgi:hypothetical protein